MAAFASAQDALDAATVADLTAYRASVFPVQVATLLSLETALDWVNPSRYAEWLREAKGIQVGNVALPPPVMRTTARATSRATAREVIEILDSDDEPAPIKPPKRSRSDLSPTKEPAGKSKRRRHQSHHHTVIELSDNNSDIPPIPTPLPSVKREQPVLRVGASKSPTTSRASTVDPPAPATTIVETRAVEDKPTLAELVAKAPKDDRGRYILTQKTRVDDYQLLDRIPERWPVPPQDKTVAYVVDASSDDRFAAKVTPSVNADKFLKNEDQDSWGAGSNGSTKAPVEVQLIGNIPCRRSSHTCNGSRRCEFFGHHLDGYKREDGEDLEKTREIFANAHEHIYMGIPNSVNEDILVTLINKGSLSSAFDSSLRLYENTACASLHHPRRGKQKYCSHIHFQNREVVLGKMEHAPCSVQKVTYTSVDTQRPIMVVIFSGQHNHLPWPLEKATIEAKNDLQACMKMLGKLGVTAQQVDHAPSTLALLGSSLSDKHPAYHNMRTLQDAVKLERNRDAPEGNLWPGVSREYDIQQTLDADKRYMWSLRNTGTTKIAVALFPALARLIHSALYIACDFTFKRVRGELNEWEVALWHRATHQRVTVARVFSNGQDTEAFTHIFEDFFTAIERATGQPLRFKVFDPAGQLLSINLDMEAAQVKGLGCALICLGMNNPKVSKIHETDPDILVQYVLKLCLVHLQRSIDGIASLSQQEYDYLLRLCSVKSDAELKEWNDWCSNHQKKQIRDWHTHKVSYRWLIPCFNQFRSRMPPDHWALSSNNTNIVETAHVGSNMETGIGLSPLEAIRSAEQADLAVIKKIENTLNTAVVPNKHNSDAKRTSRSVTRAAKKTQHLRAHVSVNDEINELELKLAEAKDRKKQLGRSPRRSRILSFSPQKSSLSLGGTSGLDLDDIYSDMIEGPSGITSEPIDFNASIPASPDLGRLNEADLPIPEPLEAMPSFVPPPALNVAMARQQGNIPIC
ncbi:hypothetical protein ONZ45_g8232 [Pleurotus djamor]|nr:hypothetical protein ONZ45_g8232 [Pleurotus djamor]